MPAGRPTKYEERFCDLLIEHMDKGLSFEAFAGYLGVSKDTLFEWVKVHPEFSDSKKIGTEKARLWWESKATDYLLNCEKTTRDSDGNVETVKTSLNSTVWIFNMKNRFRDEWKDKSEQEVNVTQTEVLLPPKPSDI